MESLYRGTPLPGGAPRSIYVVARALGCSQEKGKGVFAAEGAGGADTDGWSTTEQGSGGWCCTHDLNDVTRAGFGLL